MPASVTTRPGHLHLYITVVAAGLGLVSSDEWHASSRLRRIRFYQASSSMAQASIHLTDVFWRDHRSAAKLIKHFCQRKVSVWKLTDSSDAQHSVSDLQSLHRFLCRVRRLSRDHVPGTRVGAGSGWHMGLGSQLLH